MHGKPHPNWSILLSLITQIHRDCLTLMSSPVFLNTCNFFMGMASSQMTSQISSPSLSILPHCYSIPRRSQSEENSPPWKSWVFLMAIQSPQHPNSSLYLQSQCHTEHTHMYILPTTSTPHSIKSRKITSLLYHHAVKIGFQRLGFCPHKI